VFESRLVAQSSFGDDTSGVAGVTQLVERRLLSDPIGVRVLSPAPIIPRWRNGKRSGPRPRGPFRPWEFDSPSRDQHTDLGPEVQGYRLENDRTSPSHARVTAFVQSEPVVEGYRFGST
jgi:hypothetical protein